MWGAGRKRFVVDKAAAKLLDMTGESQKSKRTILKSAHELARALSEEKKEKKEMLDKAMGGAIGKSTADQAPNPRSRELSSDKSTKERAEAVVLEGGSLEHIVVELYQIPPFLSTVRGDLATQQVLDDVWLRIDETKQYEDRVKVLKRERLERLPSIQMENTIEVFDLVSQEIAGAPDRIREKTMLQIARKVERDAVPCIRFLALWKQSLYTPLDQLARYIDETKSLNEFLEIAPYFRAGFNASNKDLTAMAEYITKHIDTELDLISIGVTGADSNVEWRSASLSGLLLDYLKVYEASKGISLKTFAVNLNGKMLFSSDLKRHLFDLGISDGDIVTLSPRPSLGERAPLKQLHDENKHEKSSRAKPRRHLKNNTKRSGKKPTLYISPEDEMDKLKQQHSEAMSRVFEEVDQKFTVIRERLAALTLERQLPKERSKAPTPLPQAAPISNPAAAGVAGKAGKSSFLVLVGEAENLYKTSKKPKGKKCRQPKSNRAQAGTIAKVDLHGMTTEQALNRLDQSLPGWIDAAMRGSYPFVIKVEIVCGCGNQVLAEAVEAWIRRQKNVANAPKNRS